MKDKIIELLASKEEALAFVNKMQERESAHPNLSKIKDLDKNEIEIKAQIEILRFLLSLK